MTWVRFAIFGLILFQLLRRILKAAAQNTNARGNVPPVTAQTPGIVYPPRSVFTSGARPVFGKKNDFRDVPPPPENPELG